MKFNFNFFKEKTTDLYNGIKVIEGDTVRFINSDGKICIGKIQRREFDCIHSDTKKILKKGTLFLWNNTFNPSDYLNSLKQKYLNGE